VFLEPACYDPLRFAPGRAEDRQHRFALIGFGGGLHKCAGMQFALHEMRVIISLLLQQYDLELVTPDPQPTTELRALRPTPCWIRYRRRSAATGVS
jgi:sterol 14alpha-demethylase